MKSKGVRAYPINGGRVARLVPDEGEIRVEYLVPGVEQAGVEFRVEARRLAKKSSLPTIAISLRNKVIRRAVHIARKIRCGHLSYIKKRDGLSAQCHRR